MTDKLSSHVETDDGLTVTTLKLEMGLTRAEFLRSLPAAVYGYACTVGENTIAIHNDLIEIHITLGEERIRRIGSLALPAMSVEFQFTTSAQGQVDAFMTRFERAFQRGGG